MSKKGLVTSVHQRLQLIARESGREFNSVQLRYVQERFLYRLSQTTYKDAFILKGALLFVAFDIPTLRPTKDIDFLGSEVSNNLDDLKKIIQDICSIEYNDAVDFETDSVEVIAITEEKEYPGARVKIIAKLGTARVTIWLDFGFGDKIIAGPIEIDYPIMLDFDAPKIKVYSLESAIAEKFQACVKLNFDTSRMKDFYDINELASNNYFNLKTLAEAIKETFSKRETDINGRSVIFADDFKSDEKKEIQWQAFLRRTSIASKFSFNEIVERIEKFVNESCDENPTEKEWNKDSWTWK